MNEAEINSALTALFKDQSKAKFIISKLIGHKILWEEIKKREIFTQLLDKYKDDESKWSLSEICRLLAANEKVLSQRNLDASHHLSDGPLETHQFINAGDFNFFPTVYEFSQIAEKYLQQINQRSWKDFLSQLPEFDRQSIISGLGTIISIIIERYENFNDVITAFSNYLSNNQITDLFAFVLVSNPEKISDYKKYLAENGKTLIIEGQINLIQSINLYGDHTLSKNLADWMLDVITGNEVELIADKDYEIDLIINHITLLAQIAVLFRIAGSINDYEQLIDKINEIILRYQERIHRILGQPESTFKSFHAVNNADGLKTYTTERDIIQKIKLANQIVKNDLEGGALIAREIACNLEKEELLNPLIFSQDIGFLIRPVDLVNFFIKFKLIIPAARFVTQLIEEIPMDQDLLLLAGRIFHDHGDHSYAIKYFNRLSATRNLDREDRVRFCRSLEYCEQWAHAIDIHLTINAVSIQDLEELAMCLFNAERLDLYQEILDRDQFGFLGSELDLALAAWIKHDKGERAEAANQFEELLHSTIVNDKAMCLIIEYYLRNNKTENLQQFLHNTIGFASNPSITLKRLQLNSSKLRLPINISELAELGKLVPQMCMQEFEEYLKLVIAKKDFDLAWKIIQENQDRWVLSPKLSSMKGKILLEKHSFRQAEAIFKQLILRENRSAEDLINLCLAIMYCSHADFPLKTRLDRADEVYDLIKTYQDESDCIYLFDILKAEINKDKAIHQYKNILSKYNGNSEIEIWRAAAGLGKHYLLNKDFDKAIIQFIEAIPTASDPHEIYLLLISSFMKLQMWEEAINLIDPLLVNEKTPINFLWKAHVVLCDKRDWQKYIHEKIMQWPDNKAIRLLHTAVLMNHQELGDGLKEIERLISDDEDVLINQFIYAQIFVHSGEITRAKRILEIALTNSAIKTPQDYLSASFLFHQLGEKEKELAVLKQMPGKNSLICTYIAALLAMNGNSEEALQELASISSKNDQVEISIISNDILVDKPIYWEKLNADPAAEYHMRSRIAALYDQQEESIGHLENGIFKNQNNQKLLIAAVEKVFLMEKTDLKEKWLNILEQQVEHHPEVASLCLIGEIALEAGEEVKAAHYLNMALQLDKNKHMCVDLLQTRMLVANGNLQEAIVNLGNVKKGLDSDKAASDNEIEYVLAGDLSYSLWLAKAAFNLDDMKLCLDSCCLNIARNGMTIGIIRLFLFAYIKSLIRNNIFHKIGIRHHLVQIESNYRERIEKIKIWHESEGKKDRRISIMLEVCNYLENKDKENIKNELKNLSIFDREEEFSAFKIELEYLLNGVEDAEIALHASGKNRITTLQFIVLIMETNPYKVQSLAKELLSEHPEDPVCQAALAYTLFNNGQFENAYSALYLALLTWPEELEWQIFAGQLCQKNGDVQKALDHYENANRLSPTQKAGEFLLQQYINFKNPKAIPLLEQIALDTPTDLDSRIALAEICIKNNLNRKAVTYLNQAHSFEPDNIYVLVLLGKVAINFNNLDKAEYYADKALKSESRNNEAVNLYADILRKKIGYHQAIQFLDNTMGKNKQFDERIMLKKISLIEEGMGIKMALETANEIDTDKVTLPILEKKAQLLLQLNQLQEAEQIAELVIKKGRTQKAYQILGDVAESQGNLDRAVDNYMKGLQHYPMEKTFYLKLSEVYEKRRDNIQSLEILSRGLKIIPDDYDLLMKMAKYYHQQKMHAKAKELIIKAIYIQPDNSEAQLLLSQIQDEIPIKQALTENNVDMIRDGSLG